MTTDQLNYIKQHKRLPVSLETIINHGVLIFPLSFLFLGGIIIYNVIEYNNNHLLPLGLVFLIMGLVMLTFTIQRLQENVKFKEVKTGLSQAENFDLAVQILKSDFQIVLINKVKNQTLICKTNTTGFSWGEQITVVCLNDYVLINSNPTRQPVTIYKDKSNVKKIILGFKKREKARS